MHDFSSAEVHLKHEQLQLAMVLLISHLGYMSKVHSAGAGQKQEPSPMVTRTPQKAQTMKSIITYKLNLGKIEIHPNRDLSF